MPVRAYVHMKELAEVVKHVWGDEEGRVDKEAEPQNLEDRFARWTKGVPKYLPRTLQVITLTIGKEERDAVKHYLEMQVGKRYENRTLVNDCSTMTLRALGMENPWFDASPSGVGVVMALRKRFGDRSVKRIFQVSVERPENASLYLARNAYINLLDVTVSLKALPATRFDRLQFDTAHTPDQVQYYDDEMKQVIDDFQPTFEKLIEGDDELKLLQLRAKRLHSLPDADPEKARLRGWVLREAARYFGAELSLAEKELESHELRLKDVLYAQTKIRLLSARREQILRLAK